jgi:hypothetical protein
VSNKLIKLKSYNLRLFKSEEALKKFSARISRKISPKKNFLFVLIQSSEILPYKRQKSKIKP